jgi:6-phosphogluconolactonase
MSDKRVVIAPSAAELAHLVADKFVVRARKVLERTGSFRVVLTGGGLGIDVLRAISQHPTVHELNWAGVTVFWGDERFVPASDPERNDLAARAALLDSLGLERSQLVSFPASDGSLDLEDAAAHARAAILEYGSDGQWPHFDLAFAGMGPDGHVLSVFPGSQHAQADAPDIRAVWDSPKPPPQRLTMTIGLLNRSERVWMVVSGANKAAALGLALAGASVAEVPAAGVRGLKSTKIFTDAELAGLLPEELVRSDTFWSADDERADYVPKALR